MRVTKEMLGDQTRKSILYLDQNFFSSAQRKYEWSKVPMAKVSALLDLQLLAIPYSSTHLDEADLNGPHRDTLVQFIQRVSGGHHFERYVHVEERQIIKAFHSFLDDGPTVYQKEERDALCPSVHDWDGDYSVSVFTAATDVGRKSLYKQKAVNELLQALPEWANKARTFEEDMALEISDTARLLVERYTNKIEGVLKGDISALMSMSVVDDLLLVVQAKKKAPALIGAFFRSQHFANVPTVQLSARLFAAYKERLRSSKTTPDPTSKKTRKNLSGFFSDIQHAATYAPYCDAYFTDNSMAKLMKGQLVKVEQDFGCKVFSVDTKDEFLAWLDGLQSRMTGTHANDLSWVYPKRFPFQKN